MKNRHGTSRFIGSYAGDARVFYAWRGWNDAINNQPFDYRLVDSARPSLGAAYEQARLRVLTLRAFRLPVPKWGGKGEKMPAQIKAAYLLTNSYNTMARESGTCLWPVGPRGWQPTMEAV